MASSDVIPLIMVCLFVKLNVNICKNLFSYAPNKKQEAKMVSNRSPGFRGTKLERCSRLCGFREKIFLRFSYINLCNIDKPRGVGIFGPGDII